ncbi:putative DNA-binding transcriptional regulator YafY [Tahibacter aquaticus]|uniref:Putative DNA-binding transcriptional regulator YafY n=1 Tax=Tahibacter aquaticus TaxID=520092 RepID=A0A4R6YIB9_9GAMM|nr:WYL domain-containing protein [Tahibacter aquaticus]TDR36586.1 putative DNA-binding transcriptional regulator YafY [Tahibacter aquaticus]
MDIDHLRWSVIQRLAFMEQRLFWTGRFNKSDLIDRFSVSGAQANADVAYYQRSADGNMAYDAGQKAFIASPDFSPRIMEPDARAYLSQLLLLADEAISLRETWLGTVPSHAAIPKVRRRLDPQILRAVVQAIHGRRAVKVVYQSLSNPEPTERWIAPHALAFDGFRWHARAWCYTRSTFVDMVLARLLSVSESRPAEIDGALDRAWNQTQILELGPHPDLSVAQKKAIERDYGMENGMIEVPMRISLIYYFERQLCLDIPGLPPERQQVILLNSEEVEKSKRGF